MAEEKKRDPRTVTLKRVRLSFTDALLEKQAAVRDGKLTHNCNAILQQPGGEDTDPQALKFAEENKAKIIAALEAAGDQEFGNKNAYKDIGADNPKRVGFRKGERFKNQDTGEVYKGYTGNWGLSLAGPAGGKHRPQMRDRYKKVLSEDEIRKHFDELFYSGVYADIIISAYGTTEGGRGIFFSLDAIRSHQEGSRLGGGGYKATDDDFEDLDDDDSFGSSSGSSSGSSAGSSDDDFG